MTVELNDWGASVPSGEDKQRYILSVLGALIPSLVREDPSVIKDRVVKYLEVADQTFNIYAWWVIGGSSK